MPNKQQKTRSASFIHHTKKLWFLKVRENYCSRTSFKYNHFHAPIKWPATKCSIIYDFFSLIFEFGGYEFLNVFWLVSKVNKIVSLVSINPFCIYFFSAFFGFFWFFFRFCAVLIFVYILVGILSFNQQAKMIRFSNKTVYIRI